MKILNVKQTEWLSEAKKHIEAGEHSVFHTIIETPVVLVHRKSQIDENTCSALGYDVYEAYYNGGTLVSNRGDLAFAHFCDRRNGWRDRFSAHFIKWLKDRGLNAACDKNDIVVDGYKVCATCVTTYGRIDYSTIFVGVNTNLDDIRRICRKPMVKVPKGLSDYGITTEDVEQMFLDFCSNDT